MELLERVREVGADAAPLGDAELDAARQALLREIAGSSARTRGRWIGGSALVGGLAVSALVVGVVLPATAPAASAAEVLENAAEATLTTDAISPAPGQYIRIQEIATSRLGWTPDSTAPEGGWWDSTPSDTQATVVETRSLYVPADRADDWVRDYDESFEILEISGPDAERAQPVLVATRTGSGLGVDVYPGGLFNEPELTAMGVHDPRHVDGLQCYYEEMPRDPAALVKWAHDEWTSTSSCPPPTFTEPVDFNLAPPDLRAAMFRALALTDGARVVDVEGDVTTIAFPEGGESDWMLTVDIDSATGLIVGRGNLDDDRWSSRVVVTFIDAIPPTVLLPAG